MSPGVARRRPAPDRTTKKQRITGTRLHAELVKEGFVVGANTIRRHLKALKLSKQEVYVPVEYE